MSYSTIDRLIGDAMVDAGLIAVGDTPTDAQYTNAINRLNDLVNLWQTQGVKVWTQLEITVPLVAGQSRYRLGASGGILTSRPMRVLDDSYYLDSSNNKRPLVMIARHDYARLSNTTQTGPVTQLWVDKQASYLDVYMWLVPDAAAATGSVRITVQQQVPNYATATEEINWPREWYLALRWGLADELATGQPQAIMDRCAAKAVAYREALEAWDVEDAPTRFTPDERTQMRRGFM
ncbi:MAG: hypothetical protein SFV24_19100 [Gemmatimonadales bacterium]|nr:hypothetical protein [Gemmatimonadales bacterium]